MYILDQATVRDPCAAGLCCCSAAAALILMKSKHPFIFATKWLQAILASQDLKQLDSRICSSKSREYKVDVIKCYIHADFKISIAKINNMNNRLL
jgi:hypothetical protein